MAKVQNNIIELNEVYKQLNTTLDENIKRLKVGAEVVEKYNKVISIKPSEYTKGIDEINNKKKALEETNKRLEAQIKRLTEARAKSNAKTSEEIVNNRVLAQNADRVAKANSNLVGAYARLNAQHQIAMQRVRDLTVQYGSQHKATVQAQKDFDVLDKKIKQADQAVRVHNRNVGNYKSALGGLSSLMGAFGIVGGLTMFAQLTMDTVKLIKELQGLNFALKQVSDTAFAQNLDFISKVAEDFGLDINNLTKQFTQFYVSAKDKLSQKEIEQIFSSISKAGATMGLSVQQQERAFLAINQMMSKGTVQSEELRQQLGEALPGAFTIMGKALGVNELELGKMMENGELLANEVLPKFAKELEKAYGIENINRVETLTAETNRLGNAWKVFVANIDSGNGPISKVVILLAQGLTKTLMFLVGVSESMAVNFKIINNTFKDLYPQSGFLINQFNILKAVLSEIPNPLRYMQFLFEGLSATLSVMIPVAIEKAKARFEILKLSFISFFELIKNTTPAVGKLLVDFLNPLKKADTSQLIKILNDSKKAYLNTIDSIIAKRDKNIQNIAKNYLKQKQTAEKEIADSKNKEIISENEFESTQKTTKATAEKRKEVEVLSKNLKKLKDLTVELYNLEENGGKLDENQLLDLENKLSLNDALIERLEKTKRLFKETADSMIANFGAEMGTPTLFAILNDQIEGFGDNWLVTTNAIMEATKEMYGFINSLSQQSFDLEYQREEQRKQTALLFAGESAIARAEIEAESERRRNEIRRRELQAQKRIAIFDTTITTAQAVIGALSMKPFTPLNFVNAGIVGAMGAAKIAMIASQQIPQFWRGTDNAPEGFAWTQEKGREIIKDAKGNIKSLGSDNGSELTYLNKGDKVLNHSDTMKELNGILLNNNIKQPQQFSINLGQTNAKLDELKSAIIQKESFTMISDSNGQRYFRQKNTKFEELKNARLKFKTRNV